MQQRKSASGRPSGTDGLDFSYRIVVDSRYQKVAKGKSRLYSLISTQAVIHSIGAVYTFLTSLKEGPDRLAISTIAIDFLSLIIGEFGRRRSRVSFLKVYIIASTAATLLWIACVAKSNFTLKLETFWHHGAIESECSLIEPENLESYSKLAMPLHKSTGKLLGKRAPATVDSMQSSKALSGEQGEGDSVVVPFKAFIGC
ncbi:hypothetical protein FCV25MIE_03018 [Fagus crenata]